MTIPAERTSNTPPDAAPALRATLGQFATGVAIATVRAAGGERCGITMNSFASVSLDPPLVHWSLARTARSLSAFRAAGYHSLSFLAADQGDVARRFSSPTTDRFAGFDWRTGPFDTLLLDGALAHLVYALREVREAGDHVILLGAVVHHCRRAGAPLVFHGGQYWTTAPHHRASRRGALGGATERFDDGGARGWVRRRIGRRSADPP